MGLPNPAENPQGIGEMPGDRRRLDDAQRLQILLAQLEDPARDPSSTPELQREIEKMQRSASVTAPAAMRTVQFEGKQHQFPADATDDEIAVALDQLHP